MFIFSQQGTHKRYIFKFSQISNYIIATYLSWLFFVVCVATSTFSKRSVWKVTSDTNATSPRIINRTIIFDHSAVQRRTHTYCSSAGYNDNPWIIIVPYFREHIQCKTGAATFEIRTYLSESNRDYYSNKANFLVCQLFKKNYVRKINCWFNHCYLGYLLSNGQINL